MENELRYCYRVQAWLQNGIVLRCGHRKVHATDGCFACQHSGEKHSCPDCSWQEMVANLRFAPVAP